MYLVSEPCTYVQDGRVVMHRKAGAVVELSDELAAELGAKVRLVGGDPNAVVEASEPAAPSGQPVTFVEPEVEQVVEPETEEVVEPEEAATPAARRRARGGGDG